MNTQNIDICAFSKMKKKKGRYQNYILFYSGVKKNNRAMALKYYWNTNQYQKFENIINEVE